MSGIRSSSDNSNSPQSFDIDQINPALRVEYEKLMHQIQYQLILDPYLNHEQRMFLLHQRGAIENEFLRYLYNCIYDLDITEDRRDSLFQNLNKLSTPLIPIDMYSGINQYDTPDDDSDDEAYTEALSDIGSDQNDTCDDLENILLDQIELEHDIAVFNSNDEKKAAHSKNDTHDQHISD